MLNTTPRKWIGPKRYAALPSEEKIYWNPAYKEYKEETHQEMQYCDCCGSELGMEEVIERIPIGKPYRYYEAGELQVYMAKKLLEHGKFTVVNKDKANSGKVINFTRYSPLSDD